MGTAGENLRQAVQDLGPLVASLVELEHNLAGIDRQFAGIPRDCEVPKELDRCQEAADRRFGLLVGKVATPRASAEECRLILDVIGSLAWRVGAAEIRTAPLPATAPVWTRDDGVDRGIYYDPIPDGAARQFAAARYRLTTRVRLNPDGSLVNRRRNKPE